MSSDSDPSYQELDYENLSKKIIAEVKKRPALYDPRLTEHNNRHDRDKLWQDVYKSIFKNWDKFNENQQKVQAIMIQKKWKNIKDSFLKELSNKGKTNKKKRKYIHYDSLLFLLPTLTKKKSRTCSDKEARTESSSTAPTRSSYQESTLSEKNCSRDSTEHKIDKEGAIDEEKHFALMLVPMLRKLNDDQKHYAKVEILNILHKARNKAVAWPAVEDVTIHPQFQFSVDIGNKRRRDVLAQGSSTDGSDEEDGEAPVKKETNANEMTDQDYF